MSELPTSTQAGDDDLATDFDPRRHQGLLGAQPERYVELVRNILAFGIFVVDREGLIRSWNQGASNITGFSADEAVGRPYSWLFGPNGRAAAQQLLHSTRINRHHRAEAPRLHRLGREISVQVTLDAMLDGAGEPAGFVEVFQDITEQKRREQALLYRATRDTLSGLPNRAYFHELAQEAIDRAQRHGLPLSVVALDIDHFKTINDTWGHEVGDRALVACARACEDAARTTDTVGRLGGEEFALLMPQADADAAYALACRLRVAIAGQRVESPSGSFGFTASLGVASLRAHQRDFAGLLRNADAALYQAKRGGRNRVECWLD